MKNPFGSYKDVLADGILEKPFTIEEVFQTIHTLTTGRPEAFRPDIKKILKQHGAIISLVSAVTLYSFTISRIRIKLFNVFAPA